MSNTPSTLWGREPTMILATIQALIALAIGFGLPLPGEQTALLLAASAAVLGVVTRSQVAPLSEHTTDYRQSDNTKEN